MAIPTWPDTLPLPNPDGYGITPVTAFVRTDMDSGRARQRRRFTRAPSSISAMWMFSQEQYALFEAFLAYEIGLGAGWFQIRLMNGMGITPMQARFMDDPPYKMALQGSSVNLCQVTATLEVKQLPLASMDEYQVMRAFSESDINYMGDRLHEIVHVELPGPSRWS